MLVLVVAGLAIALAAVAAAGVFSVVGRRVEVGVLTIRGWGPLGFGAKASLEALLPAVIGGVLGWVTATSLITWAGPAALASAAARATSIVAALAGTLASIAIVGVVSGVAFVARHEHRHRFTRIVAAVPWEIAAFAIAWMLAGRLAEGGVVESGGIERPEPAVFLLPLMVALGAGILAARVTRLVVRRAARSGGAGATAPWLAIRRLRAGPALTSLFVVAGILTLAVSAAALATVASLRATVEAKARIFVGSEVQVQVASDATPAPGFPYPVSRVTRFREAGSLDDGETTYDLLVIEPDDFASAAYWNDAFSADPLPALLERLTAPVGDGVPVVVANGGGATPDTASIGQDEVPVTVVGTAVTFPGTSSDSRPLVVMDAAALAAAFRGLPDPLATPRAITEIWVDGPPADVQQRIDELGVFPQLVLTAEEVQDIPFIDAAVQTFLVLQVLGFVGCGARGGRRRRLPAREAAQPRGRDDPLRSHGHAPAHDACGVDRRVGCDAARLVPRRNDRGAAVGVDRRAEHRSAPDDPAGPVDRLAGRRGRRDGRLPGGRIGGGWCDRRSGSAASFDRGGDARCRVTRPSDSRGSSAPIEPRPARCERSATSRRRSRAAASPSSSAPPGAGSRRCSGSSPASTAPRRARST